MRKLLFFIAFCTICLPSHAVEFKSSGDKKLLIELFTSEGCSSCPAADRWISQFKKDARLWKSIFPLSFHVDYWDQLGWKDKFATAAYTQRQYQYKRDARIRSVYTPGFITNAQEWRGWFRGAALPPGIQGQGTLICRLQDSKLNIQYTTSTPAQDMVVNAAVLGMDIVNQVRRGENGGKTLKHDFVVLFHRQQSVTKQKQKQNLNLDFTVSPLMTAPTRGIVVWITDAQGNPLQMAGAPL